MRNKITMEMSICQAENGFSLDGDGSKKDKAAAIKWFERSASHGSGNAGKILDLLRKKSRFR